MWLRLSGLLAGAFAGLSACHDDRRKETTFEQVSVCEQGMESALAAPSLDESYRTYYRACAGVFVETDCREAFVAAADSEKPRDIRSIVEPCRQVYCPLLADQGLSLCMGGWLYPGADLWRSWAELRHAMVKLDAGEMSDKLNGEMVRFDIRAHARMRPHTSD